MAQCREKFRVQCRKNPRLKDVPIAEYGAQGCTDASYSKGAIACWLLYRLMGESAFLEGYRIFCQEHARRGASLDDFVTAMKKASTKDLGKFCAEWIYGTRSSEYLLGDLSLEQILGAYNRHS
jgi:hypothetical protein